MTNQKAIKNNIFGLFDSNNKKYTEATIAVKEAADNLVAVMSKYKDVGTTDTESVESIIGYIVDNID
jgi:hypothetical protein